MFPVLIYRLLREISHILIKECRVIMDHSWAVLVGCIGAAIAQSGSARLRKYKRMQGEGERKRKARREIEMSGSAACRA